jgi:hypothetical protein
LNLTVWSFAKAKRASVHKYLRIRDLCKELAFGYSVRSKVKSQFIQLVGIQRLVPPVPGESYVSDSDSVIRRAAVRQSHLAIALGHVLWLRGHLA